MMSRIVTTTSPSTLDTAPYIGLDFESIRPSNKDFESVALVFLRSRLCVGRAQDLLQSFALCTHRQCPLLALKNTHRYHFQALD